VEDFKSTKTTPIIRVSTETQTDREEETSKHIPERYTGPPRPLEECVQILKSDVSFVTFGMLSSFEL